jgi:hypothetical protein
VLVYHDYETDEGGLDAGSGLDVLLQKSFAKHYTVGVKYADHGAEDVAGKGDTGIFWFFGQIKF